MGKSAFLIMGSGAFGGLTSWCLQALAGVKPFGLPAQVAIPALVVVGSAAAMLGVFLANTNTTDSLRTASFALACGIFWQPVLQSAQLYVNHALIQNQAGNLQDSTQKLAQATKSNSTDVAPSIQSTAKATSELLQKVPDVADSGLKQQVVKDSAAALDSIAAAAERAPAESVNALEQIGTVAAHSGQTELAAQAAVRIQAISSKNPAINAQAKMASSNILKAAETPANQVRAVVPAQ
jgi:hypothetical protein